MLFVGIQSILFLKSIENKQKQITSSIVVSDAILEAKYFVRSDVHILYEMVSAVNNEDFAYWWGEHQFQAQFVNDQIKTIKTVFSESESMAGNYYKDSILNFINAFELDYGLKVKSKIEEVHNILNASQKTPTVDNQITISDPRIINLLKDVAKEGLLSIKGLDKAKSYTQKIVTEAEKSSVHTVAVSLRTTWILGIISIVIALIVAFIFSSRISSAVIIIRDKVEQLSKGRHPDEVDIKNRDELGSIAHSLNQLIGTLKRLSHFAAEVGNRNFKASYETLGDDDVLGNSLLEMRNKLQQAEIDTVTRRREEEQRVYVTQGIAGMGEVLHINHDSIDDVGYAIISFLVTYLKANQAIFFQSDYTDPENPALTLRATYAFDRRKYIKKTVAMGDGLAGVCFFERKSMFLTEVPDDYITITSGLGEALPRNIFIVPVIAEDRVEGVIEIASFHILDTYQIEMVEQMAKSIGITLNGMRINKQTKDLLAQAQRMEKEMKIQEDDMRSTILRLEDELVELRAREEDHRKKDVS